MAHEPQEPSPSQPKRSRGKAVGFAIAIVFVLIVVGAINSTPKTPVNAPSQSADLAAASTPMSSPTATMAGFNRLSNGMTYAQVVAIVGEPSQELARNEIAGTETVMYSWDAGIGANMNAMFQNGKMMQKAQMGLR
jgi:hypothetical protein